MEKHPIKSFRDARGLTLQAFAELLNPPVDKSTVLRWEAGQHIPHERIVEVATLTGASLADLLPPARTVTPATMDAARYEEAMESAAPRAMP